MFCTREGFEGKLTCWVGFPPGAEPSDMLIDKGGFKGAYGTAFMRDILRGDRFLGIFSSLSSISEVAVVWIGLGSMITYLQRGLMISLNTEDSI